MTDDDWAQRWVPEGLPVPPPQAQGLSSRLIEHIRGAIEASGGAIPFSQFMQRALYAPGLGYYTAGSTKFGSEGDFVTAPELSPLFGQCLARFCEAVFAACDGATVVELGAGSGALAEQVISTLAAQGRPVDYRIVEPSADLRERQRQRLDPLMRQGHRIEWLNSPPTDWRGALLANEVIDALPVDLHGEHGPRSVRWCDGRFFWGAEEAGADGWQVRIAHLREWLHTVTEGMAAGAALMLDYGGSGAEMALRGNAVRCHYRHRVHADPLALPGLQDITADVDFTAVAMAASDCGLDVSGYTTQANLLLELGIDQALAVTGDALTPERLKTIQGAKTLLMPEEMGERVKALCVTRRVDGPLPGFVRRDLRGRL